MKIPVRISSRTILPVIIFSLVFSPKGFAQNPQEVDSLKQLLFHAKHDSSQIRILWDLGRQYHRTLPDTALPYYQKALDISIELRRKKDMAEGYGRIGALQIVMGEYDQAKENNLKALAIYQELDDRKGIADTYNDLGIIYKNQGSYDIAVEYYLKSVRIKEELDDKRGMANTYNNIAVIHAMQDSNEKAIEYFLKSLEIKEELGARRSMASTYNNIAIIYIRQDDNEKAIEYFQKALTIYEEINNNLGASMCLANIGNVHSSKGSYDIAIEYYLRALALKEELGDKNGMGILFKNIADLNIELADSIASTQAQKIEYINKSINYGKKALELAKEIKALPLEASASFSLHESYKKLGKYREALEYAEIYMTATDSLFTEEKTKAIQEMATKYETEKKEQQIELQESELIAKDATIKQQKILRNALAAGFVAVVIIIVVIVYAYRQKRKDNKKIKDQNEQILEANEELTVLNEAISRQNNEIIDSINYAQRIQAAMLPPEPLFNELLDEVFILYRPRDIVSGDFYWIKQVNQYTILVAADCTGHGVPGAFMSLLGMSFLNEIVQRREITQANQVLNELRLQIKHTLRQHGLPDESKDGIDMSLCVINSKDRQIQFSGANNPIYLIREIDGTPELVETKADRMPIGYFQGKDRSFTNHDIDLKMGDTLYIFSDGFIDQKGGKENKKLMSKNFKNLLLSVHDQPMFDQKKILERKLADWMGDNNQTDDILVIGFRVL